MGCKGFDVKYSYDENTNSICYEGDLEKDLLEYGVSEEVIKKAKNKKLCSSPKYRVSMGQTYETLVHGLRCAAPESFVREITSDLYAENLAESHGGDSKYQ